MCIFAKTFSMNVRPKLVTSKELQNIFTNIMTMFFLSPKHEIGWRKTWRIYIWLCWTCQVIWLQFRRKWLSSRLQTKKWKRYIKEFVFNKARFIDFNTHLLPNKCWKQLICKLLHYTHFTLENWLNNRISYWSYRHWIKNYFWREVTNHIRCLVIQYILKG